MGLKCYEGVANWFKIVQQPQKEQMDQKTQQNVGKYSTWVVYVYGSSLL